MKDKRFRLNKGFTLIEILVVITILAILIGIVLVNFVSIRERARDAKRKSDMLAFRSAMKLYYIDHQRYPDNSGAMNQTVVGCGTDGDSACPVCLSASFASGGSDGCSNVYLKSFPSEFGPGGSMRYYQDTGVTDDFCIVVNLENSGDPDLSASWTKCGASCGASTGLCNNNLEYCICSDWP